LRRLLLVDDSPSVRDALHAALDPYGFELVDAENGAVALQLLVGSRFDLAFVDLNMPVLDGPALVRLMRARGVDTRVVLVTSGADTPTVTATIKAGASEYVAKPFTPEQIREVAARVLGLDAGAWVESQTEVIVQHANPWVSGRLRGIVPARVKVSSASTLAATLELAEAKKPSLVLLDDAVLDGDVASAAALVREVVPRAGIFALSDNAHEDQAWRPEGALDGALPLLMPEPVVRGFLYPIFLRPLVFAEPGLLRAAGFEGEERFHDAYFTALARALGARGAQQDPGRDLVIDLARVPADEARFPPLLRDVRAELDAVGAAPAFRVPPALVAALRARPELSRAVILPAA
jgi:DNA-binding response OmpR family regulator